MNYLARIERFVSRLEPEDLGALQAFQAEHFGDDALQLDAKHRQWLFDNNPYKEDARSTIWIYKKDGVVHGQQSGIPFRLIINGHPYSSSWSVDSIVREEYRLRGIGSVLASAYTRSNEITVGVEPTEVFYKAAVRADWIEVGKIPVFLRPLNVSDIFIDPDLPLKGLPARLVGVASVPVIRAWDVGCAMYARAKGVTLEPIERFDYRVDAVWEHAGKYYSILALRDYRSVSWRFDMAPNPESYRRYYMFKDGNVCGYVVLRERIRHGVPLSMVVDFLCPPDLTAALFSSCLDICRKVGSAAVYFRVLYSNMKRRLAPLGFLQMDYGIRLMINVNKQSEIDRSVVSDPANWFITWADSDAEHRKR